MRVGEKEKARGKEGKLEAIARKDDSLLERQKTMHESLRLLGRKKMMKRKGENGTCLFFTFSLFLLRHPHVTYNQSFKK